MVSCAVLCCKSNKRNSSAVTNGITFHKFPENPRTKYKWKQATGRAHTWYPSKYSSICSNHFKPYSFKSRRIGKTKLFDYAVPTEYLQFPPPASMLISRSNEDGMAVKKTERYQARFNQFFGRCRCCLIVGYHCTMDSVFEDINKETTSYSNVLQSMFRLTLTKINVGNEEKLPLICSSCEERLHSAYNLYLKIQASEETTLRQLNMIMSKSKAQGLYLEMKDERCYIIKNPEDVLEDLYKIFADRPPAVLNEFEDGEESRINKETNVSKEIKSYPIWDDTDDDSDVIIVKDVIEKVDITNELYSKVSTIKNKKNETVTTICFDSKEEGEVAVTSTKLNVSEKNYKKELENRDHRSIEDSPKDCGAILCSDDDIVTKYTSEISFSDQPVKVNTAVRIQTVLGDAAVAANSVTDTTVVNKNAPIRIKTELEDGDDWLIKTDLGDKIVINEIKTELKDRLAFEESIDINRHIEESGINTDVKMIKGVFAEAHKKRRSNDTLVIAQENIEDSGAPLSINKNINKTYKPVPSKHTNPYKPVQTYTPVRNEQTKVTSGITNTADMNTSTHKRMKHINNVLMKTNTPVIIKKADTADPTNTVVLIKADAKDGVDTTNTEVRTKTDMDDPVVSKDTQTLIQTDFQNTVVLYNRPEEVKIEFELAVDTTKEPVHGPRHVEDSVVNQQYYNNNCSITPMLLNSSTEVAKNRRLKDTSVTTPNQRGTAKAPSIKKKKITIIKKNIVRNKPTEATTSSANIDDTINMYTSVPIEINSDSDEDEKSNDSDFEVVENVEPDYNKRFHCVYCQKRFNSKRQRSVHYKKCIVLKKKSLKMKCSFCLAVMGNNYNDISEHMLQAHGFTTVVRSKIEPTDHEYNTVIDETSHDTHEQGPKIGRVVSESQPLKCPKCMMMFDFSVKMSEHMLSAHRTSIKPHSSNSSMMIKK